MKLTVLGSGAAASTWKRNTSSYLIENNSNFIVFDLGFGTFKTLQKHINPEKIGAFFFSHFEHADHVNDLISLLAHFEAVKHKNQLTLFGPKGFKKFYEQIIELYSKIFKNLTFNVKVNEIENSQIKCFGFIISSRKIRHSNVEAIALKIETENKSIVYSGDTDTIDDILEFSKNSSLLICDSTYPHSQKKGTHLSAKEAGMLAQSSGARKLLLTHFNIESEKTNMKKEAEHEFKGEIITAEDNLVVEI